MSWRSSGWRVLAWTGAPKPLPMPAPPPAAPPPAPTPSAIARPAFRPIESPVPTLAAAVTTGWRTDMKSRSIGLWAPWFVRKSVFRDRVAEVDRGEDGEDECLQTGDQHGLEQEDRQAEREQQPLHPRVADEHAELTAHERDQNMARQQVGPESDGQRDQPQEVREDLDHEDQRLDRTGDAARHQALDRTDEPVMGLDPLPGE